MGFHLFKLKFWSQKRREIEEILGWALLTASSFFLILDLSAGHAAKLIAFALLLIGLYLVFKDQEILGLADSTKQLLLHDRAKKAKNSLNIHHNIRTRNNAARPITLSPLNMAGIGVIIASLIYLVNFAGISPAWQAMVLFGIALAGTLYVYFNHAEKYLLPFVLLVYLTLATNTAPLFSILTVFALAVGLVYYSHLTEQWKYLLLGCILSYLTLARWLLNFVEPDTFFQSQLITNWLPEWIALHFVTIALSVLFIAPFVGRKRILESSKVIKGIFFTNFIGFILLMLGIVGPIVTAGYIGSYFISLVMISVSLGYIAWLSHGRLSYAKYFYFLGLLLLMLVAIFRFDVVLLCAWIFSLSVLAVVVGFMAKSYTARIVGYVLFSMSLAYYGLYVMPLFGLYSQIVTYISVVWLGVLLASYSFLLAYWTSRLPENTNEKYYKNYLSNSYYFVAFILAFSLLSLVSSGLWLSVSWLVLVLVAWIWSYLENIKILHYFAVVIFTLAILKIAFVDLVDFSAAIRLISVVVLGIILIFLNSLIGKNGRK